MAHGLKEQIDTQTDQKVSRSQNEPLINPSKATLDSSRDLQSPSLKKKRALSSEVTIEKARQEMGAKASPGISASLEAHRRLQRRKLKRGSKGSGPSTGLSAQSTALSAAMKNATEQSTVLKKAPQQKTFSLRSLFIANDQEVYLPTILDKLITGIANLLKKLEQALTQSPPDEALDLSKKKKVKIKVKKKKAPKRKKKTGFYQLDKDLEETEEIVEL